METIYLENIKLLDTVRVQIKTVPEIKGRNNSKSFTIKGIDCKESYALIKAYFDRLAEFGKENIKIVCYKEGQKNGNANIKWKRKRIM